METKIILYSILGILVLILLLQKKWIDRNSEYDSYADDKNQWSILTSFSNFKILSKYAGEFPHGPLFIHLKTTPNNVFHKEFFADWFYKTDAGVYLQKWNSNPLKGQNLTNSTSDLVFIDTVSRKPRIVLSDVKALWFEMEINDKDELELILNNIKSNKRITISNANNVYNP